MTRLSLALAAPLVATLLAGCPSGTDDPAPPAVAFEPNIAELGTWSVTEDGLPESVTVRLVNRGRDRVALTGLDLGEGDLTAEASIGLPVEVESGAWVTVTVAYAGTPTGPLELSATLEATVTAVGATFDQRTVASAEVHVRLTCDADGDGFDGEACGGPDCDDLDVLHNPSSDELCNGLDDDCNGLTDADDDGEADNDGDGSLSCADCDDGDADVRPGATEACDGVDTDCNPATFFEGGEIDYDSDGYLGCEDCDDEDHDNAPGNPEVCDGQDNDCDGSPAEEESDDDGDGETECDGDCDDGDPDRFSDAVETPDDGVDSDCDGSD